MAHLSTRHVTDLLPERVTRIEWENIDAVAPIAQQVLHSLADDKALFRTLLEQVPDNAELWPKC